MNDGDPQQKGKFCLQNATSTLLSSLPSFHTKFGLASLHNHVSPIFKSLFFCFSGKSNTNSYNKYVFTTKKKVFLSGHTTQLIFLFNLLFMLAWWNICDSGHKIILASQQKIFFWFIFYKDQIKAWTFIFEPVIAYYKLPHIIM